MSDKNKRRLITEIKHESVRIDLSETDPDKIASTENVCTVSERLMKQNKEAYKILAK